MIGFLLAVATLGFPSNEFIDESAVVAEEDGSTEVRYTESHPQTDLNPLGGVFFAHRPVRSTRITASVLCD